MSRSTAAGRKAYAYLYKRKKWRQLRQAVLDKEPFCRYCKREDKLKLAEVVDHIKPHKGDMRLFYQRSNLAPCCYSCHNSRKQQFERGGYAKGCNNEGDPTFSSHWDP